MKIWKDGNIQDLLREGRVIQQRLKESKRRSNEDTAKIFAKLVFQGKINAALKLLSSENENGVHDINDEIIMLGSHQAPNALKLSVHLSKNTGVAKKN